MWFKYSLSLFDGMISQWLLLHCFFKIMLLEYRTFFKVLDVLSNIIGEL